MEVHSAIRGWVCRHAGRIRVLTDLATVGPRARSIIYATCVAGVDADRHGEEVGPALAQAAGHYDAQTCDARGATSGAVTQAVGVFAGGDAIAKALATKGTAADESFPSYILRDRRRPERRYMTSLDGYHQGGRVCIIEPAPIPPETQQSYSPLQSCSQNQGNPRRSKIEVCRLK